jgi:hypothetical protein
LGFGFVLFLAGECCFIFVFVVGLVWFGFGFGFL